ncbi:MAG: DUF2798 domain-containing protein [Thiofilum sp.]|uniref:DUF2798 domain-containing protein n=1 Tax=Thiofilum sp. TaxID=2212733 RepID=UPI002600D87A|nr:DUF2798 domain-containing protein [Thiofilum sp.]MBK8453602.1 DUF2798 domain-containing protein [Thiofilum sp.]
MQTKPPLKVRLLFALFMSFSMALIMTFIIVALNTGFDNGFLIRWGKSFLMAFPIAFGAVLVLAPQVQKLVARLT